MNSHLRPPATRHWSTALLAPLVFLLVMFVSAAAHAQPTITTFTPTSGPVGTDVTINGTNLTNVSQVRFNGTPATVLPSGSGNGTTVVARVPVGATSGPISLDTPGGTTVSPGTFTVTPRITSISPNPATIGTTVTITGNNLSGTTQVQFNGVNAQQFNNVDINTITAVVPPNATSGQVTVTTNAGSGNSGATNFIVKPRIDSLSTTTGTIGSTISIFGAGFQSSAGGTTRVVFSNGVVATATIVSNTQIDVTVPQGAVTGPITVTTNFSSSLSSTSDPSGTFRVIPNITGISPSAAAVGDRIAISGTGFVQGQTTVTFSPFPPGVQGINPSVTAGGTTVFVTVPAGARSGPIVVTTPDGSDSFNFIVSPSISSFSPMQAAVGDQVTITGTNFTGTVAVYFSGITNNNGTATRTLIPANFTNSSDTTIVATVPEGTTTGPITVTTVTNASNSNPPANTFSSGTSASSFSVPAPIINRLSDPTPGFEPSSASVGDSIIINGKFFSGATSVTFSNNVVVSRNNFEILSDTQIRVTVPQDARTGPVKVTTPAGTGTSADSFNVPAPTVTSFTPTSGRPGTVVTITGSAFTGATVVNFGNVSSSAANASVFSVDSPTQITATVPQNAVTGPITVTTPAGSASSQAAFIVRPLPAFQINNPSVIETDATNTTVTFTVTRTGDTTTDNSVNYLTANGTAVAPGDYTSASGTLNFAAGDTTKTISVTVIGDSVDENDETFTVTLSNPTNDATITTNGGVGTATIIDNDAAPTVSITGPAAPVSEAAGTATFTVTLSSASGRNVNVNYATANGTAAAGSDYQAASGTLTFTPGETSRTIAVPITDDTITEVNETFIVSLSTAVNATLDITQATGTIVDNDGASTLSINNVSVIEGNSGTKPATFTITRSGDTSQATSVTYTTQNGTATAPQDYAPDTNTVTIAAGQTSATVTINVVGEALFEDDETFSVVLSNPSGATFAGNAATITGTATIINDDAAPSLSIADNLNITEGNSGTSVALFTVTLSSASGRTTTVDYTTSAGMNNPATVTTDYQTATGTLTFNPGETTKTIPVTIVGDTIVEPNETFVVSLSNPTGGATLATNTANGRILDDDGQLSISVDNVSKNEGNSGLTDFVFTVALSAPAPAPVTVSYATANGTGPNGATAPADYQSTSGTLTFAANEQTKNITVKVVGDMLGEPNETFFVNLSGASGAVLANNQGIGTIINDDLPSLSITSVSSVNEGDAGTVDALFTVTLSDASNQTVTVRYDTADNTATGGPDFTVATNQTLTFAPGETTKTIAIPVRGDALNEGDEDFFVTLSSAVNATIASGEAKVTVVDNDATTISFAPTTIAAAETASNMTFTVTLSRASSRTITVNYDTTNGSATAGEDYTQASGVLTFAPGQTSQTITVPLSDDVTDEDNETFTVTLSAVNGPSNATLGAATATGTIADNDPTPSLSINDVSVVENEGTAQFTVTLSAASGKNVTVNYATANGNGANSAASGSDYTAVNSTLTFAPGETTKTISVILLDDNVDETDETYTVTLTTPANATLSKASGTGTIVDNEGPNVTISDPSVNEGNSSTTNLVFTVTLSAVSPQTVTVNYATANGTATAGVDYTSTSGTLTFAPNETTRTITIPVSGDMLNEGNETVLVNLSGATASAAIVKAQGTGTITNDDIAALTLNTTNATLTEGGTATQVTVSRNTEDNTAALIVNLTSNDADSSEIEFPTSVTIPANQASVTFTVTPKDDDVADGTKTIVLTAAATGFTSATTSVTVADADALTLTLTNVPASITEGSSAIPVTVSRNSEDVSTELIVTLSNSDAAQATVPTSVTIPIGASSTTFNLSAIDDNVVDGTKPVTITASAPSYTSAVATTNVIDNDAAGVVVTKSGSTTSEASDTAKFTVKLTSQPASNVTIALSSSNTKEGTLDKSTLVFTPANYNTEQTVTVTGVDDSVDDGDISYTIVTTATSGDVNYNNIAVDDVALTNIDNDGTPTLSIDDVTVNEGNSATTTARFTVSLSSASLQTVTVNFATTNGSAVSGSDYASATSTLTFAPGESSKFIDVVVNGDTLAEGNETFSVMLSNASNAVIGRNAGVGTITNDDGQALTLSITPNSATEGSTATGTLTRNSETNTSLTVNLSSSDATEATVPNPIVIPAGQASTTFQVNAVADDEVDGTNTVVITATASGFTSASANFSVVDSNGPTLSLTLSPETISENEQSTGTVTRNSTSGELTVNLSSTAPGEATVRSTVTIPAGQRSVTFSVVGINDGIADGTQGTRIVASAAGYKAVGADLTVTDVTPSQLTLTIQPDLIEEGGVATGTVTRNTSLSQSQVVTLSTELRETVSVPETVTILAGQASAQFQVRAIENNVAATSVTTTIKAQSGAASAETRLTVRNNDTAGVVVRAANDLRTTEAGGTASFTVRLNSQPQFAVGITVTSNNLKEGTVSTKELTFTPTNWNVEQTVTVRGVNDSVVDGNKSFQILLSSPFSGDSMYKGLAGSSVNITNTDNEVPGVRIVPARPTLRTSESGGLEGSDTFTIVLTARPVATVRVGISVSDTTEGKVPTTSVAFTPDNWSGPQTIRVNGLDDRNVDGDVRYTVMTTKAFSPGNPYDGLEVADLPAINVDNEDNTTPVVRITSFENGASFTKPPSVAGTTTDAGPRGVVNMSASLLRVGSPATSAQALTVTPRALNDFSTFKVTLPATLAAGRYLLTVNARDGANNVGTTSISFSINSQRPLVAITSPANGRVVTSLDAVRGTASVPGGLGSIANVKVVITREGRIVKSLGATLSGGNFTSAAVGILPDAQYVATVTATDTAGNQSTATSTFIFDRAVPTSVAITSPASGSTINALTRIEGSVTDNSEGAGIDRVELIIQRRSDNRFFNGTTFVARGQDADGDDLPVPTVRATLSGNTFSYSLPSLPADPDPLNAIYSLTPIAFDKAGNKRTGAQVNVQVRAITAASTGTTSSSTVRLSTAQVTAATSTVTLTFVAALDAETASDANRYAVTVNGVAVEVEGASYRRSPAGVTLSLPEGSVRSGDSVVVKWSNLLDSTGKAVNGSTTVSAR